MENGTYEQFVSHLERELKLNGLEAPNEMQINIVTQRASQNAQKGPNQFANLAKSQVTIETSVVNSNEKKTKPEITRKVPKVITIRMVVLKRIVTPTIKFKTLPTQTMQIIRETENLRLSTHLLRPVVELTTQQRNVTVQLTQRTDRLPGLNDRKDKTNPNREMLNAS